MMSQAIHPAFLGSAALAAFRSMSKSSRLPLHVSRLHSASSFCNIHIRSLSELHLGKLHNPALTFQPSNRRCKMMHCYCTKASENEDLQKVGQSTTVTDPDKKTLVENNTTLLGAEQVRKSCVNDSGIVSHNDECNSEDDEPIDRRALVELEVELLRQEAYQVPDDLSPHQWEELLSKTSRSARKKYLRFLFLNQMKKEGDRKKKELRRLEREKELESIDMSKNRYIGEDGHIQYGLWCNTIFLRIHDSTMNYFNNGRVISAMMHGQPIVIDLGFDEHMQTKERQNCANQLMNSFAHNRNHPDPFHLQFCNADNSSDTMQRLKRFVPTLHDPEFPLTLTPDSYLDCFPKEKLVYLTPHCKEEVTVFDHNAVYIIGAIVDLGDSEPLTLAKARREGIKMQKLPLERYLNWGMGGKSLTINQTLSIMLDLKHTGDWYYSLRHIPRRKLKTFGDSQEQLEKYMRRNLRNQRNPDDRYQNKRLKNVRVKSFYAE